MNGKLARAIRRHKDQCATLEDIQRLQRKAELRLVGVRMAPKPLVQRKRLPSAGHAPTWPNSDDQRAQSRPIIVERPIRRLAKVMMDRLADGKPSPLMVERIRSLLKTNRPKHYLDKLATAEALKD